MKRDYIGYMKKRANSLNFKSFPEEIKNLIKSEGNLKVLNQYINISNISEVLMYTLLNASFDYFKELFNNKYLRDQMYTETLPLLFKQAILHNKEEFITFLLEQNTADMDFIEDGCVMSVQCNNKNLLNKIYNYGIEKDENFSLSFKNNVCLRIAINKKHLDIIFFLHERNINPFGNHIKYHNHHLSRLIKRDDEDLLDFYLDNGILTANPILLKERNLFKALIINDLHYPKGLYYAEKIILKLKEGKNSFKELSKLYNDINYIYPKGTEEKVAPLRNLLKTTLNKMWLESKVTIKEYKPTKTNKI